MRLSTTGKPYNVSTPIVGRITTTLDADGRDSVLLTTDEPSTPVVFDNFQAVLTSARWDEQSLSAMKVPVVHSLRESDHLHENDIVVIQRGHVRTLYRPDSVHNTLFVTERCNSNCLMCSQPPKDHDDIEHFLSINHALVNLLPPSTTALGITGGEPTLLGTALLELLRLLKQRLPTTHVHLLTNGRLFAWPSFAQEFASVEHPDLVLGIPLYSDDATEHDYVVQARGSFDQTVLGLHQLARWKQQVELRIVLHRLSIPRLAQLAAYIYHTFPFVVHVALMGLEPIGYTPYNRAKLWIDPHDYEDTLVQVVEYLSIRGMHVSIYNLQHCILPKPLWVYTRKSISDWKNIYLPVCETCTQRSECAGFFQSAEHFHSAYLRTL